MKYRVISGWVTVTGPPSAICRANSGTTLPAEPRTLPNRTIVKRVSVKESNATHTASAARLLAPIMLLGLTALSVDIKTNDLIE